MPTVRHAALLALPLLWSGAAGTPTDPPWIMGYAVGYERDLLPPAALHWADLTHVVIGRAVPAPGGTLNLEFDVDSVGGPAWARAMVAQAHAHHVQALLMIGGAGEHDAFVRAAAPATRAAFVRRLLAAAQAYGFDGLDLDWEPLTPRDEAPLLAVARALKAARPDLLLTVPVGAVNVNFPAEDARPSLAALARTVDRVNIMTYGMASTDEGWAAWHSSALTGETGSTPTSVHSSVNAYRAAGIPAAKLGVGIGFYGLCYQGVTAPRQQVAGMRIVASDGQLSAARLQSAARAPGARHWDARAQVPYLSAGSPIGPQRCTYVSYEDAPSITLKGQYARQQGLGGVIIWTLAQGHMPDGTDPLLAAVHAAFRP